MARRLTCYERLERSSVVNRRRLRQEELILEMTEKLVAQMAKRRISRKMLARRLGRDAAYVQRLLGGRIITLTAFVDAFDAVGARTTVTIRQK